MYVYLFIRPHAPQQKYLKKPPNEMQNWGKNDRMIDKVKMFSLRNPNGELKLKVPSQITESIKKQSEPLVRQIPVEILGVCNRIPESQIITLSKWKIHDREPKK